MKKYKEFAAIRKQDIQEFKGLENEISFAPYQEIEITPLKITRFGITNPDKNYYVKRDSSPCFILEYIVSGVGYLEINGEKHRLEATDAYIIHPGDCCKYYSDEQQPYKKYWINFDCMLFFSELLKAYDINDRVIRGIDLSQHFEELFKLENFSDLNDELYIPISKIIFNAMMDIASHKKKDTKNNKSDIAYRVKVELNKSVTTDVSISSIAKKLYCSENDIIRKFKKKYGVTPYAYLIDARIRRAKNILMNTNNTLSEIASKLCFSSEYHFSNSFKKRVGVSPREFRRRDNFIKPYDAQEGN